MPAMEMEHIVDPRESILASIGDLSNVEVFNNQVLCAIYMRPKDAKTKSGLYLPDSNLAEDEYQSKVGLIVKMGNHAFIDDTGRWFNGATIKLHDWVVFRPSDGWNISVNKVKCRMLDDVFVRMRIEQPDQIW